MAALFANQQGEPRCFTEILHEATLLPVEDILCRARKMQLNQHESESS
jgi:hypothetical protein